MRPPVPPRRSGSPNPPVRSDGTYWANRPLGPNLLLQEVGGLYLVLQRCPLRVCVFDAPERANAFALELLGS